MPNEMKTHKPAANTDAIVDITPVSGVRAQAVFYGCAYDVPPAAGRYFTIESPPGTIKHQWPVTAAGPAPIPVPQVEGEVGQVLRFKLAADSGGAIGVVNVVQR